MPEYVPLVVAFFWGLVLGALFFGGLWLTVRFALFSRHSALVFLLSLLARTAVTLGGFYLATRHGLEILLPCFLGFLLARAVVTWRTRPATPCPSDVAIGHAS